MQDRIFLGPQRLEPNVASTLDNLGIEGPVAAITAGWQEREGEIEELSEHLRRPVVDLMLHRRGEETFEKDPELFRLHRARQDHLRALQRLYRYRLDFALEPARVLLRRKRPKHLLPTEQEAAIEAVRRLDAEHLARIVEVHHDFDREQGLLERPSVLEQKERLRESLEKVSVVLIAGGHVAVLLNRMRLFGLAELLSPLSLVAWSAGAMALCDRLVLFHDSPPQGAGNAEILEMGLGLVPGVVPLPHAKKRLRLDDEIRVGIFARRFAPALPLCLDAGTAVRWKDEGWRSLDDGRYLTPAGEVLPLEAV